MKIKNSIFEDGRVSAINELILRPMPISEAYKLVKLVKELKEKETVYFEAKRAVFNKYGKKKKNGDMEIKPQNIEAAKAELNELMDIEEEYSMQSKLRLPKEFEISAKEIMQLEDFVEVVE